MAVFVCVCIFQVYICWHLLCLVLLFKYGEFKENSSESSENSKPNMAVVSALRLRFILDVLLTVGILNMNQDRKTYCLIIHR